MGDKVGSDGNPRILIDSSYPIVSFLNPVCVVRRDQADASVLRVESHHGRGQGISVDWAHWGERTTEYYSLEGRDFRCKCATYHCYWKSAASRVKRGHGSWLLCRRRGWDVDNLWAVWHLYFYNVVHVTYCEYVPYRLSKWPRRFRWWRHR